MTKKKLLQKLDNANFCPNKNAYWLIGFSKKRCLLIFDNPLLYLKFITLFQQDAFVADFYASVGDYCRRSWVVYV